MKNEKHFTVKCVNRVPVTTTYPARGVLSEYDDLNLGMCGLRASAMSEYAYLNSDCIIVLGARLSERTIAKSPNDEFFDRIIHVNIDDKCLKGGINLCMDVKEFLNCLLDSTINKYEESAINDKYDEWIDEIYAHDNALIIDGIEDIEANYNPLRAPYAINKIMGAFEGAYFLSDAGTHTTWTTLLAKCDRFAKLLFSGGFGPMGYGLPAAIGVAVAHPDEKVVVVCGDGDIQMVSQELATIHEYDLNIAIFVINNSQLGIIRQWQDTVYDFDEHYQVDLINPDFVKLAESYGIGSFRASDKDSLLLAIDEAGNIVIGDEMLTPDSSRFWPADSYEPGHGQPSFDKQFARDWLKANPHDDWTLPQDIVDKTIDKYLQAYELLTGKPLN